MHHIDTIVTHPGGAHKDDFLACSVLLSRCPAPIRRREPSEEDLENASICVVDVGHRHEPEKLNFDHHQFPKDYPPTCALSLVLQHFDLDNDAKKFFVWLEPAEWFDCLGGRETSRRLGAPPEVMKKLISPIDMTLLRRFAMAEEILPGSPIWEIMKMIGADIVGYVETLRARLEYIGAHAEFWTFENDKTSFSILFMPRTDPLPADPSMGLEAFIERHSEKENVAGMVYPDRRNTGYGLSRYNDDMRLDFARIDVCEDVHFAHARGFVAKSSAVDPERLKALITNAWIG